VTHGHASGCFDRAATCIIAHLTRRYDLRIHRALSPGHLNLDFMVRRTLDNLYWTMSFSRWRDERFWPSFHDALLAAHSDVCASDLEAPHEYNQLRYHYQGIGRYELEQIYARGIDDLRVVADLLGDTGYVFGPATASGDAAIYGFVANIYFYEIAVEPVRALAPGARAPLRGHSSADRQAWEAILLRCSTGCLGRTVCENGRDAPL
jgi:hypothetical protein